MKITKVYEGYNLLLERIEQLLLVKPLFTHNQRVSFYDYRRNNCSLNSELKKRGDLELVSITMDLFRNRYKRR